MKIGIILGSIREGRAGESVATWVLEHAREHGGADFELLDLASFDLPLLTDATVPSGADRNYASPEVTAWGKAIDACDAFVLVTPEYNHGVPGALKNAVDSIYPEWYGKSVGLVSYGADGGVRAVEQWRQIFGNMNMHAVRQQVSLSLFTEFGEDGVAPSERRAGEIATLLDQLLASAGR